MVPSANKGLVIRSLCNRERLSIHKHFPSIHPSTIEHVYFLVVFHIKVRHLSTVASA